MKYISKAAVIFALLGAVQVAAQSNGSQDKGHGGGLGGSKTEEDIAWEALSSSEAIRGRAFGEGGNRAGDAVKNPHVNLLKAEAELAKDFYQRFPNSVHVKQAKRKEAISLVRSVNAGDVAAEGHAWSVAQRFREDLGNATEDRFSIAVEMTHMQLAKARPRSPAEYFVEYENLVNALVIDFPGNPDAYRGYLGIIRSADRATAKRVAEKVVNIASPEEIKEVASRYLRRFEMDGSAPSIEFIDEKDRAFDMASLRGNPVVIEVWTSNTGPFLDRNWLLSVIPNIEIVSINLDEGGNSDLAAAKVIEHRAAATYFDKRGRESPMAYLLNVTDTPSVYVLDSHGRMVGSGRAKELSELLSKL